ncbi:hypothetical protein RND71_043532 [Anisodus tanguticus]|uniref:non-specific serine/threonine protein kinase n=1 Tax=Anisodus tanguticus TaxID=243964 RepID=A0AAE1UR67_9SOLA|nr:hypothetical protein RND71_043532 [Anisodus tanguticus]
MNDFKNLLIKNVNPHDDYDLIQKVGSGTYGDVYKARCHANNRLAAIKILKIEDQDDFETIESEIRMMKGCVHPNIVEFYGSYIRRDKLWICMEYCGGGSLQDIYHATGSLPENVIAFVCREVLYGLKYLHSSGKMHRDIKGANILLSDNGDIKLADFGISAQITTTMNCKRKTFIGTPYWMAPEVAAVDRKGGYNQSCDIWAVGITAIELAELQPPMFDLHPMRAFKTIALESKSMTDLNGSSDIYVLAGHEKPHPVTVKIESLANCLGFSSKIQAGLVRSSNTKEGLILTTAILAKSKGKNEKRKKTATSVAASSTTAISVSTTTTTTTSAASSTTSTSSTTPVSNENSPLPVSTTGKTKTSQIVTLASTASSAEQKKRKLDAFVETEESYSLKLEAMRAEKENAVERAETAETMAREANQKAEKSEEEVRSLQKKIQQVENELDQVQENLTTANTKLEEKDKALQNAEGEVAGLNRRIQLIEEDLERSEERLQIATQKLEDASRTADESERNRKLLEHRSITDEERMDSLENQLKEARMMAEDADRKYDEVARKLAMVEADLERAEQRAEEGESLKLVLNSLRDLYKNYKRK